MKPGLYYYYALTSQQVLAKHRFESPWDYTELGRDEKVQGKDFVKSH